MGQRFCFVIVLCLALAMAAVSATDLLVLYHGEQTLPASLTVGMWGAPSGTVTASPVPLAVREDVYGIPVTTQGRYQGVRFDFSPAPDTAGIFGQRGAFLEVDVHLSPQSVLSSLRCTLFTEKGIGVLAAPAGQCYPMEAVDGTWTRIAIPLDRLHPDLPIGGVLRRLVLSSDTPAKFTLGRLAFVRDTDPFNVQLAMFPSVAETGKPVVFTASTPGNLTPCAIRWDFDTDAGASIDATGERVRYTFANPGLYTVSCTVLDPNGWKEPVTVKKEFRVIRSR